MTTDHVHSDTEYNTPGEGSNKYEYKPPCNGKVPDPGSHYRFKLEVSITPEDIARHYVVANLDPYRVAKAYHIRDHAQFSALKKILCAGNRGRKNLLEDIEDSICALQRWKEIILEDRALERCKERKEEEKQKASENSTTFIDEERYKLAEETAIASGFCKGEEGVSLTLTQILDKRKTEDRPSLQEMSKDPPTLPQIRDKLATFGNSFNSPL